MATKSRVNNAFYDQLETLWLAGTSHPVALLRAENALRNPWIASKLPLPNSKVLDIGCGGGLLTNALAERGHTVVGIDLSSKSLEIAKQSDATKSVSYLEASADNLPFEDHSFDAVCAMDLLEHVENPAKVIEEASRVLKKGGLFFFHTFNRNWLSWLIIIKGVEWCVRNTPPNMHQYGYFLTPEEVTHLCTQSHMKIENIVGVVPQMNAAFWKMLLTREVSANFRFKFTQSLKTGYSGYATLI